MPPLLPQAHLVSTQPSRMSDYEMRAALTLCYDLLGGKKKLIFEQFTWNKKPLKIIMLTFYKDFFN